VLDKFVFDFDIVYTDVCIFTFLYFIFFYLFFFHYFLLPLMVNKDFHFKFLERDGNRGPWPASVILIGLDWIGLDCPLVVFYNKCVAGVRVVEFGTNRSCKLSFGRTTDDQTVM